MKIPRYTGTIKKRRQPAVLKGEITMRNILKNKRMISGALILLSLILVLFCAGLKINRAAANLVGLGGALMDGADFYEDASGGGDGLAQTSAAVLRSISDGRFSGLDALFDSLRLERLIIALADDLGTDSETVLTAILLLLFASVVSIYWFNLDTKLVKALEKPMTRHYDDLSRDHRL